MAWPSSGVWDGLSISNLPDIIAALCNAISERKKESYYLSKASSTTINWITTSGTSTAPTASDFVGMTVNSVLSVMDQIIVELINLGNNGGWKTSDTFANALTLDDAFDTVGLLTRTQFENPQHLTHLDWYLTAKGVLDLLVYRTGQERVLYSGSGYKQINFDDARDGTGNAVVITSPTTQVISRDLNNQEWYVYLDVDVNFIAGLQGATNADYTVIISRLYIASITGTVYAYSLDISTSPTTHTFTDVVSKDTTIQLTNVDASNFLDPPFNTLINNGYLYVSVTNIVKSNMTTFLADQL